MSLITRGRVTLTVYPLVDVDDGYGGTKPGQGAPVPVSAQVFPSSTEELPDGLLTGEEYTVIADRLPAGPWSRVDWDGEVWAVVGDVRRYRQTLRTSYDSAIIRRRSASGNRTS